MIGARPLKRPNGPRRPALYLRRPALGPARRGLIHFRVFRRISGHPLAGDIFAVNLMAVGASIGIAWVNTSAAKYCWTLLTLAQWAITRRTARRD